MHILTKVFIVFAAVLSVVLAALTMAYSINADTIATKYADALREAETAKADGNAAVSQYSNANAILQDRIAELQNKLANAQQQNLTLSQENQSLLTAKTNAEHDAAAIKNQIGQSQETVRAMAAMIESLRNEITKLRTSEFSLRKASLDLEDRVNDLASQNEVYEQTIRALREQVAAAQRAAETTLAGTAGNGTNEPFEATGPVIHGSVTRVTTDPASGEEIVEVDVGSNDRVAENMKLHVGRGNDTFVATLVVVRTDLQSSVARISLANDGLDVQPGDIVVSRFGR